MVLAAAAMAIPPAPIKSRRRVRPPAIVERSGEEEFFIGRRDSQLRGHDRGKFGIDKNPVFQGLLLPWKMGFVVS
jgi:hypothetical protein